MSALARRSVLGAVLVLAMALAATPVARAAERTSPPGIGETAPELQLRDQNGRTFNLHEVLKEREFIVLAFYPKAFTTG